MANHRVESIGDLLRWDLDLTVQCRRCNRLAVFDAAEVRAYLVGRGHLVPAFPPPIATVCKCGSRDHRIAFADKRLRPTPLPPRKLGLVAIYVVEAG